MRISKNDLKIMATTVDRFLAAEPERVFSTNELAAVLTDAGAYLREEAYQCLKALVKAGYPGTFKGAPEKKACYGEVRVVRPNLWLHSPKTETWLADENTSPAGPSNATRIRHLEAANAGLEAQIEELKKMVAELAAKK